MQQITMFEYPKFSNKNPIRLIELFGGIGCQAKASGVSNIQLYKQAGNGIVVNVLMGIFKNLNLKGEIMKDYFIIYFKDNLTDNLKEYLTKIDICENDIILSTSQTKEKAKKFESRYSCKQFCNKNKIEDYIIKRIKGGK